MTISEDINYPKILNKILLDMNMNIFQSKRMGRDGLIDYWLNEAKLSINIGPKSLNILRNDLNVIIDTNFGVNF